MKPHTRDRLAVIAAEIRAEAFLAQKAKNPRQHFYRIDTLAREASDYFAFGFEAPNPSEKPQPEPVVFGFTCPEHDCWWNDSETQQPDYPTMREALDAADLHRATHENAGSGIVTHERLEATA